MIAAYVKALAMDWHFIKSSPNLSRLKNYSRR